MYVGGYDDFCQAVVVQVAHSRVVIKNTPGIAAFIAQLGPTGSQRAVVFQHPGVGLAADRAGDDQFQGAVSVQVVNREAAQLAVGGSFGPLLPALVVIDVDVAFAVGGDDLQVAVALQVSDDDAGPDTTTGWID